MLFVEQETLKDFPISTIRYTSKLPLDKVPSWDYMLDIYLT